MKLELSKIEPQTPTEAALLAYARHLEGKISYLADTPPSRYDVVETMTVQTSVEVDRAFLRGLAMCSVRYDPEHFGYRLIVKSKPEMNSDKIFQAAILVPESHSISLSKTALLMGDLYKEGLHGIARIYE